MAKHARPDDEKPWIGPVGMVYFEERSGKFWRREINQYAYVGEHGEWVTVARHANTYNSYEEMPVGSVVSLGMGKKRFARKTSEFNEWRWV